MTDKIKVDQIVDYQLRAGEGQSMLAVFKPSNPSAYFNVLPPDLEIDNSPIVRATLHIQVEAMAVQQGD